MTDHEFLNSETPEQPEHESAPSSARSSALDPWTASLVQDAMHVEAASIPREMMWARIRQQRTGAAAPSLDTARTLVAQTGGKHAGTHAGTRRLFTTIAAIAATLVIGVAIGRYTMPGGLPGNATDSAAVVASANGAGANGAGAVGTNARAAALAARATDPAVVAMEEHFARTVALLTTVRDENPNASPGADVTGWARELLGTTRMLLDEPQLHDDRTRRLLQDLELVLVQIIQARGTAAPEAKRAPSETMRETNLLPRVRAVVTASVAPETTIRGFAE